VLLGRVGAITERCRLACLGEVQEDQDREPDDRREACVRSN
jgi:hypothetical protein